MNAQLYFEWFRQDLDDYDQRIQEEGGRQGELTKLCGLAFSTGAEEEEPADPVPSREKLSLPLNLQGHNNSSFGHSPVQGKYNVEERLILWWLQNVSSIL